MIDPAVERQYSDTRELLALWNTFHQFFTMGVKGDTITPEKENQFLEIKSRIAMLHDSFMEALTTNQNVGQEVLNIITRAITLKHLGRLSTADTKKMEIEWHESYLLLNDTIAALEQKRRELSEINETHYKAGIAAGAARQKASKFFGSFYFKLTAIIVAVLAATIGVQSFGIYDYDELGKISALQTPYRWGKAVVRAAYDENSPWPDVTLATRKGYSGWPEGIKAPVVDSGITKDEAATFIARQSARMGIGPQMQTNLQKASDYQKETAEKSGQQPIQIHTFLFSNTEDAKAIETLWEEAKSKSDSIEFSVNPIKKMDVVRDVNIIVVVYSETEQMMREVVVNVYGKKA